MPGAPDEIANLSAAAPVEIVSPAPAPAPQLGEPAPVQPDQAPAQSAPAEPNPPPELAGADTVPLEHPPTLLDGKPAEKPADAKPAEKPAAPIEAKAEEKPASDITDPEAPATEEQPPEPAPVEPVDYFAADGGLVVPEVLKFDDATKGEVIAAFDALRVDPKKGAQALLDLHAKQMTSYAEHVQAEQWRVFREMGADELKKIMADPVLGGAGHDTAMAKVLGVRDLIVSDAKPGSERYQRELAEFNTAMRITGAGNMLPIMRALHNAWRFVREASPPPPDPRPPKDAGRAPNQRGKLTYTHPTSNADR